MPISPAWDPHSRVWTLTTSGTFSIDEISDLVEKTDWKGETLYLWDLRDLVKGPDSAVELRRAASLVERSRQLWEGSRAAIVVARDLDFGIARMFQAFADGINVEYRIFRDKQSAIDWLGSSPVS